MCTYIGLKEDNWMGIIKVSSVFFSNRDVKTSRDTSTLGRGRGRGGGERRTEATRGRGAKTSSLVQTSGLFSEGTGEAKMRRSSSGIHLQQNNNTAFA